MTTNNEKMMNQFNLTIQTIASNFQLKLDAQTIAIIDHNSQSFLLFNKLERELHQMALTLKKEHQIQCYRHIDALYEPKFRLLGYKHRQSFYAEGARRMANRPRKCSQCDGGKVRGWQPRV